MLHRDQLINDFSTESHLFGTMNRHLFGTMNPEDWFHPPQIIEAKKNNQQKKKRNLLRKGNGRENSHMEYLDTQQKIKVLIVQNHPVPLKI